MADFRARQRVQLHDGTDEFAVTSAKPIYVHLSDGTETANVNASNQLEVEVKNAVISVDDNAGTLSIDDNGSSISIDDGGNTITVDGSVSITGSVDTELTTADLDTGAGTDTRAVIGMVLAESGGGALVGSANPMPISDNGGDISIDDGGNTISIDGTLTGITNDVNIADGGNSITVDDGGLTLSIDGTLTGITNDVNISDGGNTITVDATQLDIDSLNKGDDEVLIWVNTAKDGTGTDYVPIVDSDGHLQVDVLNAGDGGEVATDDAAFTVATDKVAAIGALADDTAPDSVDEGDIGIPRMTLDRKLLTRVVGATDANRLDIDASGHAQVDLAAVSVTAVPVSADSSANSETNPIYVQVVSTSVSANEVQDQDTQSALAKDGTDNHDYTVAGTTFLLKSVIMASSGAMKCEIQAGPVAALVTKAVVFTSGAKPTEQVFFDPPIEVPVAGTGTVRVIRRNDDNQAMDVYSTIIGMDV